MEKQGVLNKDNTEERIHQTLNGMGDLKALRADSFQVVFYQKVWSTVGGWMYVLQ